MFLDLINVSPNHTGRLGISNFSRIIIISRTNIGLALSKWYSNIGFHHSFKINFDAVFRAHGTFVQTF